MTEVEQFQFHDQKVRVIDLDGESWWIARDVCDVLEIERVDSALRSLDDDEKGTHTVSTPGGPQNLAIVNESGLFSLILRSRKPEAKAFKKWVTSEVLPAIRRTGSYRPSAPEADTPLATRLAEIAHREHVIPASAAVLAHARWNNPKKGMERFGSLCVQLELDFRPLSEVGAHSRSEITSGQQDR